MPVSALDVFVNCPFDEEYAPFFQALIFTIHDCGFVARCVLEDHDVGTLRLEKLGRLIREAPHGIHDLTRTELDAVNKLPRFNMPLELGLFLGARLFGDATQRSKRVLILDREAYRYQKFCSDLAGLDPRTHDGDVERLVDVVRTWLRSSAALPSALMIPGEERIVQRYRSFEAMLPDMCRRAGIRRAKMPYERYADFVQFVVAWQQETPL